MSIQPKIKIEFFEGVYGDADCIRMLLSHAKIKYEYVGYDVKQYEKLRREKGNEFNEFPKVTVNGKEYGKTIAILRMIGA